MSTDDVDEHLIARLCTGDAAAFKELYLATSDKVFGYALSILRNKADAEDVMHDAYLRVYHRASTYRPQGKPLAWVLAITRNLCYDKIRSRGSSVDVGTCDELAIPDGAQTSLDRIVLRNALELLESQERQIVILHAISGMKHREIAELLELPTGTVLSKYHRSLKRLKDEIAKGGDIR